MKIKSILLNLFFVGLWGASMLMVYNQNYARSGGARLTDYQTSSLPQTDDQRWFDIFLNDNKIGYAMNSFGKTQLGYVFKDYSFLRLPMAGALREVLMDFYAVVDYEYALKSFTFGLTSGDYSTDIFGQINGESLELKIQTGQDNTSLILPAGDGIYLPGTIPLLLAAKGFPTGNFSLPGLDPFTLTTSEIFVAVGEKKKISISGKEYEVYRVELTASGANSTMWITPDGALIREEEAGGMRMALTTKQKALDIPDIDPEWDILKSLAVGVDGKIFNPREATYLKVELIGIEPAGFNLQDDFQRIVSTVPLVLEIKPQGARQQINRTPEHVPPADFTKPEPFIQSDDPRIIRQAKLIVEEIDNDSSRVAALTDWVFRNVEKDLAISLPSAIDVLRVRRGDCNEHTALFTAMARAVGYPTKICLGIVYKDDYFYYHAWPAVYIEGRWVPIDPTFGQHIADATHIKLLEGSVETQAGLMRIVGRLKARIIDYSTSKTFAEAYD